MPSSSSRMQSPVTLIPQLAGHIIAAGGKRLRPGADPGRRPAVRLSRATGISALAACVEFIHTATLLHDDVVDESDLRRGLRYRQRRLGQQGQRAGRRFPVQPRLPADGRGRLAATCCEILSRRLRRDRRGRGAAAATTQRHRHQRAGLSGRDPRQDGGAVRRGLPDRRRRRRPSEGGGGGAGRLSA